MSWTDATTRHARSSDQHGLRPGGRRWVAGGKSQARKCQRLSDRPSASFRLRDLSPRRVKDSLCPIDWRDPLPLADQLSFCISCLGLRRRFWRDLQASLQIAATCREAQRLKENLPLRMLGLIHAGASSGPLVCSSAVPGSWLVTIRPIAVPMRMFGIEGGCDDGARGDMVWVCVGVVGRLAISLHGKFDK